MSLWLLKPVFQWSSGFCGEGEGKKSSFKDVKEVSDRAVITACQIAPAQEMIWIPPPPFSHSTSKQKTPHTPPHSLICLGGALLGGGSAWTERALPEDYRMGGGDMCDCERVYICVGGVYICAGWVWGTLDDGFGVGWSLCAGGGLVIFFFSKMLQLSPRLNSAGR